MLEVRTLIIGAGSAGVSAMRRVKEYTDDFLIVHEGPYGTTCARVGCMPSKVFIQAAKDFHRREAMAREGILGTESLKADTSAVLAHVRSLRDRFTGGMRRATDTLAGDRFIAGRARILAPGRVEVAGEDGSVIEEIKADRLIIATGASPIIPHSWDVPAERILTSKNFFEQENMPQRIAVIGLGVIGLELGQALSRLGHTVTGFDMKKTLGGLSDPAVAEAATAALGKEFPIWLGQSADVRMEGDHVVVDNGEEHVEADMVLASLGVRPNVHDMGMENLGVELDERGIPPFDRTTMQIADLPVYIAGDVNGCRAVLHEAIDEGFIAGRNSGADEQTKYCRRAPLRMSFCDPQIAVAGAPFGVLDPDEVVSGEMDFSGQARAMVELRAEGLLRIYAEKKTGRILGSEMAVPEAEHLAHQIAWAVQQELTVQQMLELPFYHPVIEEGLKDALLDLAGKLELGDGFGRMGLCGASPEEPLC